MSNYLTYPYNQKGRMQTYHLVHENQGQSPFYKFEYCIQGQGPNTFQNHLNQSIRSILKDTATCLTLDNKIKISKDTS